MRTKTIIALFVLLLGAGGAFWITSPRGDGLSVLSLMKTTEKDPRFTTGENTLNATSSDTSESITEENVARNYTKEIMRLNTMGQGTATPIKLPTEEKLTQIVQEELSKSIPVKLFTEKDIVVGNSSDKAAIAAYLAGVAEVYKINAPPKTSSFSSALSQFISTDDARELALHAAKLSSSITGLIAVRVPPTWKTLHLEMLNIMQARLTYIQAMINGDGTQLKTVVALNSLNALLDEEQLLYAKIIEKRTELSTL